ncbi:hypothetical protein [Fluviispira multicolorata]|uniref:Uncharacterized protein n=1 Tax=Fluviispira multicolorata TaxID=2654512 RepID=A0A833N3S9_9BACT|nr:hypothetical protein [Fluviispira multicolorata]KAB8029152.1 hypothetical protein GCL57_11480 [Fluviispira multicolorata]
MSKQSKIIILSLFGLSALSASIAIIFLGKKDFQIETGISQVNTANAAQEFKDFPSPDNPSTPSKYNAWYVINLGNIPIGLLVAGTDNLKTGISTQYSLQFVSRIGSSPLLSILKGEIESDQEEHIKFQQTLLSKTVNGSFKEIQNIWRQEKNSNLELDKDSGATLQGVIPALLNKSKSNIAINSSMRFFYFEPKDAKNKSTKTFIPFSGYFINNSDIDLKYDEDGFLNTGKLILEGGNELLFARIEQDKFSTLTKTISETLIDFGWFASLNSMRNEFDILRKSLVSCALHASSLNNKMIRYMPQSSYLAYRRIVNMSHFCSSLNRHLSAKDADSTASKLVIIANSVKNLLKENSQELPYYLAYSPDTVLFYNDTISFLWPRITSLLVKTAINELENNFELDKSRKSLVGIQLNISNMQPRAVVRAQIKLIDSSLNFNIETAQLSSMSATSLSDIPSNIEKPLTSIFLDGQYFAKKMDLSFDEICKANNGKIGLDIGDAPQIAINAESIRGVWDVQTRIELARQFAIKSTIAKNCSDISFRVPVSLQKAFSKELEQFKSEVLGSENELLLSNNIQKKLWIVPGKYRLVVTSLVTGAVLSAQEFSVASGVNTNVTAKIN